MTTPIRDFIAKITITAILFASFGLVPTAQAATFNVSNSSELQSALNQASGGDTILLASGNYSGFSLSGENYSSYLTIKSANPSNPAVVSGVQINNSSRIRLDSLTVRDTGALVYIDNSSYIEVLNSDIGSSQPLSRTNPNKSQLGTGIGIDARNSSNLLIDGNYLHDASIATVRINTGQNIRITNNRCDWITDDCFKLNSVNGALFQGNIGASNWFSPDGAHPDFMQSSGGVQNGIFRNNVAIQQTGKFQGLFFGGNQDNQQNNLIENNLIVTTMPNGILIYPDSNTVRNNTVLRRLPPDAGSFEMVRIVGESDGGNIMVGKESQAGFNSDGDLVLQWENPNGPYYYDDYFKNADSYGTLTYADFEIVAGSDAEDYGATDLTNTLVNSGETGIPPGGVGDVIVGDGTFSSGGDGVEGLLNDFESMSEEERAELYERIFGAPAGSQANYVAPDNINDILAQLIQLLQQVNNLQKIVLNNPGLASPQIVLQLNQIALQLAGLLGALR